MLFTGDIVVENPVLDAGRRGAETTGGHDDGTRAMDDPALPAAIRDEMRGCVERTRQAVPEAT
jgi:hypothetical protein